MRAFCTLFDSKFLPQGLALYESLVKYASDYRYGPDFVLYVLPLDYECERVLAAMAPPGIKLVHVEQLVSDMKLAEIRVSRTHREWAWTCASQLCLWLMDSGLSEVTYLDADVIAFSSLEQAFDEIGDRSIAVTLHRLIPSKKHLEINGSMNVGWITFRDTPSGRACLSKWARQVRERCSEKIGCGDQKYLDDVVPDHGDNVCVFENIGVNAAPWNIGNWTVTEGPCVNGIPIVTFHAHEFLIRPDGSIRLTNYELRQSDKDFIYSPYVAAVKAQKERIAGLYVQA